MPPTSAFTPTSSENWARFWRSPSETSRAGAAGFTFRLCTVASATAAGDERPAMGGRPVRRSSQGDGEVASAGRLEQTRAGHGALAMAAHDGDRASGKAARIVAEVPELAVRGGRQVPLGVLALLADIEYLPCH